MPFARLILLLAACLAMRLRAEVWPGADWQLRAPEPALDRAVAQAFESRDSPVLAGVRALLVVQGGEVVAERYRDGFGPDTRFLSWSMAKSLTHALAGILVREGRLVLDAPLPVPEWQADPADPRRAVTLDHALRMSTGLAFSEDYTDLAGSDAIRMLFGDGARDMGGYAAAKPLVHPPGTHWYYSSGTTNIVSRVVRDAVGGSEAAYRAFVARELLGPIGIRDPVLEFDDAGTLIGSSLVFMTARDYARFGLLYLRDGEWDGRRILPEGWVRHACTPTAGSDSAYGAHWWLRFSDPDRVPRATRQLPQDAFMARGHQEQAIVVVPSRDAVIVLLSLIDAGDVSELQDYLAQLVAALPGQLPGAQVSAAAQQSAAGHSR
jgi:CubicO group peptidase (beta-lactamase class C family)